MGKSFNEIVKEFRVHRGLTQVQFATMCRVSRRTIARIEAGQSISERLQGFISKLIQVK